MMKKEAAIGRQPGAINNPDVLKEMCLDCCITSELDFRQGREKCNRWDFSLYSLNGSQSRLESLLKLYLPHPTIMKR